MRGRFIVLSGARTTLEKLCDLEKCAWGETIHSEDGAELNLSGYEEFL